jgi:hypothetical protein
MDGIREKGEAERAEGEGSKIIHAEKKKVAKITTERAKRDLLFKLSTKTEDLAQKVLFSTSVSIQESSSRKLSPKRRL